MNTRNMMKVKNGMSVGKSITRRQKAARKVYIYLDAMVFTNKANITSRLLNAYIKRINNTLVVYNILMYSSLSFYHTLGCGLK